MIATAPFNAAPAIPGKDAASLEYGMYLFSKGPAKLTLVTSPLLNFMPGRDIRLAVSIDNEEPQYVTIVPDDYKVSYTGSDWPETVLNQSRHLQATLNIPDPGHHTLKIWMVDPGVIVEKIILDTGGLKRSYLGPPESVLKD